MPTLRLDVFHHFDLDPGSVDRRLLEILTHQQALERQMELLMASTEKVQVELDRLNTITTDMATTIDEVVAADAAEDKAFQDEIDRLKAIIAAGDSVTQEQLDALAAGFSSRNDQLTSLSEALKVIGTNPSNPLSIT